ncbi:sensor histidine kinase [Lucifera butyrica]|nr:HAMP domain-containing sensor histidine kinase [Lucifera butyrica]
MLFFVFISLGMTLLGLEKFYIWQKKEILISSSKKIYDLYEGNPEAMSLELERLGNTMGAGILIFSADGRIKYSSFFPVINDKISDRMPPPFLPFPDHKADEPVPRPHPFPDPPHHNQTLSKETIDNNSVLEMQRDTDLKIDFMVLRRQLKNNDALVIRLPLAPISESATVAAQFMALTGVLAILAGGIWAFFFAGNFTRPVRELNRIAQSMSKLDFSQKCTINRRDEIGELGNSINHLSDQLDTAISELNRKNQQLMADVEKERKLDKMRKEFVSNVSHELKTPLALILGYAEGLKENIAQDEDSRNYYCSIIIDEAEKMDKLVRDLLNLSQFDSGFFKLSRADFDLSILLKEIVLKYRTVLAEKGITLELDTEESCLVNGDILRSEQVLLNLINNAIDHTEFARKIKIYVENYNEKSRIYVYNSGRPIPTESLEKIWTSFYKVDEARTREYGGYGLGLSIVRAIQELHGNRYGVENVPDGVIFWFELDRVQNV